MLCNYNYHMSVTHLAFVGGQTKPVASCPFIRFFLWSRSFYNKEVPLKSPSYYVTGFMTCCGGVFSLSRTAAPFHLNK